MNLRFKKRIAVFNMLAAASSTLVVFTLIYAVVYFTAYRHLDSDIMREKHAVIRGLSLENENILVLPNSEWQEKEHNDVEVNPTFLQIVDERGALIFQSANLKHHLLQVDLNQHYPVFSDQYFYQERIRQGQFPLFSNTGKQLGFLTIGVSQVESALVLRNLLRVLAIAFPLLCIVFYAASSYAAERGIAPVAALIRAAKNIDDKTLSGRLPLPAHRDEIFMLAENFNELLSRVEHSLNREKQITADISHELRTPLAAIRGTLEVLLRKDRSPEQYKEKLERVLLESGRMNTILEQLLQLSRIEAGVVKISADDVNLNAFCRALALKWDTLLTQKSLHVEINIPLDARIRTDAGLLEIMTANLLGNAIKYGKEKGVVRIDWDTKDRTLSISDDGDGISPEHLPFIFDRFYRSDQSRNSKVPGAGLGLSIAKKIADIQGIQLKAMSRKEAGATFLLQFPVFAS